jgi:phosphatidylserine/phosphatidylglycerophosphate/cardiolipin synthase-like enzyme
VASSPTPTPAPPGSSPSATTTPSAVTVCFTPGGNCTDAIVNALGDATRTEKYSSADFLANQGVSTMIDAEHAIAHNKVIIIDGELVLTESFNFTKAAQEKNAESLPVIRDQALAAQYTQSWDAHRQHRQPYIGRGVR